MGYSLNNIVGGVIAIFLGTLAVMIFNPLVQIIFGLFTANTLVKATMTLIWWIGLFFIIYFIPVRYVINKVNPSGGEE